MKARILTREEKQRIAQRNRRAMPQTVTTREALMLANWLAEREAKLKAQLAENQQVLARLRGE